MKLGMSFSRSEFTFIDYYSFASSRILPILKTSLGLICRYMILPWCMLTSLSLIMLLLLKLLPLKELSSLAVNVISVLIGAPLGLYVAHWVCIFDCLEPVVRKVNNANHRHVVIFSNF